MQPSGLRSWWSKANTPIVRIRARSVEGDFDGVAHVLQHFGWELRREEGSHASFGKDWEPPIVIPKKHGRKVKQIYLDKICQRLGLDAS